MFFALVSLGPTGYEVLGDFKVMIVLFIVLARNKLRIFKTWDLGGYLVLSTLFETPDLERPGGTKLPKGGK